MLYKTFITIVVTVIVFIASSCNSIFFWPKKGAAFLPERYGYNIQNINFKSSDNLILNGWYLPSKKEEKGIILHFHGNSENIETQFLQLSWVTNQGYSLFTFDYRGFGESQGEISVEGANQDAISAFNLIVDKFLTDDKKLILYGQSIGGTILLSVLHKLTNPSIISAVIIEGSFLSYPKLAHEKSYNSISLMIFSPFVKRIISNKFGPDVITLKKVRIPLLVIHSLNDEVVDFHHGEEIANNLNSLFWKTRGKHLTFTLSRYNRKKIIEYIDDI